MEQKTTRLIGDRYDVFAAADGSASLPLIMIDSGNQHVTGVVDYYTIYKRMVDAALLRDPKAEVNATFWREGNQFKYEVSVKNLSGKDLVFADNEATVNVIVYEDVVPAEGVAVSSRTDRAVVTKSIVLIRDKESDIIQLSTTDLTGVVWSNLHSVVFVEYRPAGKSGPYDMLQAAVPVGPWFKAQPQTLSFLVDALQPKNDTGTIQMAGSPEQIAWQASSNVSWLLFDQNSNQASGQAGEPVTVYLTVAGMKRNTYTGAIAITAAGAGKNFTQTIPVTVAFTDVVDYFLPAIHMLR